MSVVPSIILLFLDRTLRSRVYSLSCSIGQPLWLPSLLNSSKDFISEISHWFSKVGVSLLSQSLVQRRYFICILF